MEYYIEPAEQMPEVQEQLKAITPTSLNPEELTLLDPACGSGHILVEAYDLFKAIYQERGYRAKDIPALILQKNLFGLEIDERAAQLAAFALMMKARGDDRRIFDSEANPNVMALQDSRGMDASDITRTLNAPINKEDVPKEYLFEEIEEEKAGLFSRKALAEKGHVSQGDIAFLLALFENAKTFGSLIQVPLKLAAKLPEIEKRLEDVLKYGDLMHASAQVIKPLLRQARLLAGQYDAVVANPPYMGTGYFNPVLKEFVDETFSGASGDLYAAFALHGLALLKTTGTLSLISIPTWLFLPTYQNLREHVLTCRTIECLVDNGRGVFGPDFGSCQFVIRSTHVTGYRGQFLGLKVNPTSVPSLEELEKRFHAFAPQQRTSDDFLAVPGYSISPYIPEEMLRLFKDHPALEQLADVRQGVKTGDIDLFLRFWHEVSRENIFFDCTTREQSEKDPRRWYPCNKGGDFCRWFGNLDYVINWWHDGYEIRNFFGPNGRLRSRPQNLSYFFKPGITWSTIVTMGKASFRISPASRAFESGGSTIFPKHDADSSFILGVLNSSLATSLIEVLSPKISLGEGAVARIPVPRIPGDQRVLVEKDVEKLVRLHREEWTSEEGAYGFSTHPFLAKSSAKVEEAWERFRAYKEAEISQTIQTEQHLNDTLRTALSLERVVEYKVERKHITLREPDARVEIQGLLSYAIGCMMGRYSLDKPGLIYAHSGGKGFDPGQYQTFPADEDGIIPLNDLEWFEDDDANRLEKFIATAWPKEHLEENLKFVADSLGPNRGERPRETIRRYLATGFYKHHLSMYKKRPIYWLFCSGKHRAFQCLVYLHRYHEGTLSRMRIEYVIPLQGKIASRIGQLADDIAAASSTSHRKKLEKERDTLVKQQAELRTFDEKLRHYADKRISLDLDDGVKVNYGKFGDLLADVKAVTGGTMDGDS